MNLFQKLFTNLNGELFITEMKENMRLVLVDFADIIQGF